MNKINIFLLIFVIVISCNSHEIKKDSQQLPSPEAQNDLEWLTNNLFSKYCAGCHNSSRAPAGIRLSNIGEIREEIAKNNLVPMQPEESIIFTAITTGEMPPRGDKPEISEINFLRCWLQEGALEQSTLCIEKLKPQPKSEDGTLKDKPKPDPQKPENGNSGNGEHEHENENENENETTEKPCTSQDITNCVKFVRIQNEILHPRCTSCHNSEDTAGTGINLQTLESTLAATTFEDEPVIKCSDPENSPLYKAIATDFMPDKLEAEEEATPLNKNEKLLIYQWIKQGCIP